MKKVLVRTGFIPIIIFGVVLFMGITALTQSESSQSKQGSFFEAMGITANTVKLSSSTTGNFSSLPYGIVPEVVIEGKVQRVALGTVIATGTLHGDNKCSFSHGFVVGVEVPNGAPSATVYSTVLPNCTVIISSVDIAGHRYFANGQEGTTPSSETTSPSSSTGNPGSKQISPSRASGPPPITPPK